MIVPVVGDFMVILGGIVVVKIIGDSAAVVVLDVWVLVFVDMVIVLR